MYGTQYAGLVGFLTRTVGLGCGNFELTGCSKTHTPSTAPKSIYLVAKHHKVLQPVQYKLVGFHQNHQTVRHLLAQYWKLENMKPIVALMVNTDFTCN